MTDTMAAILNTLFSAQAEKTPREHRVYTFHYNEKTRKGQREFNAAKELEGAGLVRLSPGVVQKNIFQILPRC